MSMFMAGKTKIVRMALTINNNFEYVDNYGNKHDS